MKKNIDITVAGSVDALNDGEKRYELNRKEYKRGNSWIYCHEAFFDCAKETEISADKFDYLALHLAFYLASWGMLRNSFLLNVDYKIHIEPVKMMMEKKYRPLFEIGNPFSDKVTAKRYKELLFGAEGIYHRIEKYYIDAHKAFLVDKEIHNESDTLLTKILLGVYGCVPAYDRYFRKGLSVFDRRQFLNKNGGALFHDERGLGLLLEKGELKKQLEEYCEKHEEYTFMKVVDMYFFSVGAAIDEKVDVDTLKKQIDEKYGPHA